MAKRSTPSEEARPLASQEGSLGEHILAGYLGELKAIHASGAGVAETSFYGPGQGAQAMRWWVALAICRVLLAFGA